MSPHDTHCHTLHERSGFAIESKLKEDAEVSTNKEGTEHALACPIDSTGA